jgi:SAM-dependent methyltransferase
MANSPTQPVAGIASQAGLCTALPNVLHLGSGKSYRADYLNVDVSPMWRPDIVWDLNHPMPEGAPGEECGTVTLPSDRFGAVSLGPQMFDEAIAMDVLEHVQDLTTAMTTVLRLLKDGGIFRIGVPYELSLGAWSDPTHVRAFNERSWVYYCQWSWYLGWRTHNFHLQKLEFQPSDYGRELIAQGLDQQTIVRTPRAIDSMHVELVKKPLSPEEQALVQQLLDRPR